MIDSRSYILDRLKSKTVSIDEFNFDRLQGPSVYNILPQYDIYELDRISRSISLSAKPLEREKEITRIMNKNGFIKFYSGTNRISFRPMEDNSYIVKIALDDVGRSDAPREFQNQMVMKPFVCKIFDVIPGGAISTVERVIPITSADEFRSIASDIYEVITNWFIGEYVVEDFGTEFFMNWGIRKGFGPVLLDYPYIYKLDGNKLFCNVESPNSPTGRCDGVIDYDAGYNHLYCAKCGVMYRASELKEAIKNNIIKTKGESKMKIKVSGGSLGVEQVVAVGAGFSGDAKRIPNLKVSGSKKPVSSSNNKKNVSKDNSNKKKEQPKESKKVITPIEVDESIIKDHVPTTDPIITTEISPNGGEDVLARNYESILEDIKNIVSNDKEPEMTMVDVVCTIIDASKEQKISKDSIDFISMISDIVKWLGLNDEDREALAKAICPGLVKKEVTSPIDIDESIIKDHVPTTDPINVNEDAAEEEEEEEEGTGVASHIVLLDLINNEINRSENPAEVLEDISNSEVFTRCMDYINSNNTEEAPANEESAASILSRIFNKTNDYHIEIVPNDVYYDEDNYLGIISFGIILKTESKASDTSEEIYNFGDEFSIGLNPSDIDERIMQYTEFASGVENEDGPITGFQLVSAVSSNIKDIFQDAQSKKVIVLGDENGNYITNKNREIIAIDTINDHNVDAVSIVSSSWLSGVMNQIEKESDDSQPDNGTVPTGVFAPDQEIVEKSVNGVPVKED